MEPRELEAVRLRMRRQYELGRVRRSLFVLIPILALCVIAWRVGEDPRGPVVGGAMLALVTLAFLWRGQRAGRAVLPALLAGLLPFGCALYAHCAAESRLGLCALACAAGSVVAGLVIARLARRADARAKTWTYAGAVTLLTGSLGCACIGLGGLAALVLGLASVAVPSLLTGARATR